MSGSREIGVFPACNFSFHCTLLTYYACAAFNKALKSIVKAQLMERDAIYVQSLLTVVKRNAIELLRVRTL